jgi:serine/threonine protein phosphatase PrpC
VVLVLRYSARSDRGLDAPVNQDAVYAGPRLLAISDGSGPDGHVASALLISALAPLDEDEPHGDPLGTLREAGAEAISALHRHRLAAGSSASVTAVLFAGTRFGLLHDGATRAYRLRGTELTLLTPPGLRQIGHNVRAGDCLVLCTRGLHDVVPNGVLAQILFSHTDPREAADRLIELALTSGGRDNVTCVVAHVVDVDFGEPAVTEPVSREPALAAPPPALRDGVFLCYRRSDTSHPAGRLYDRLAARLGEQNVFMDVDSLAPGSDFEDDIAGFVARSALMLVLVGPGWLGAADRRGASRLDDPQDPVRAEIALAVAQGVPVVPVLVDGATMPARSDLPSALAVLTRRTSLHLAHRTFRRDAEAVAEFVAAFVAVRSGH